MSEPIHQSLTHVGIPVGPHTPTSKRTMMSMTVTVDFDSSVPADVRVRPAVAAQREYLERQILNLMSTDAYKQGLHKAALSHGTEGVDIDISYPPTYSLLHQSFMRFKYGAIQPTHGEVSPPTYGWIISIFLSNSRNRVPSHSVAYPLMFEGAELTMNCAMPDGMVRWFYPERIV